MPEARFLTAHVSEIPSPSEPEPGSYEWKPVRHHFDVRAFGVNAMVAPNEGDEVVEEHDELPKEGSVEQRDEELYFVTRGRATFTVAGETIDAPAGTFVFVRDPAAVRSAIAREAGTTVLAVGAEPGVAYSPPSWERTYIGG